MSIIKLLYFFVSFISCTDAFMIQSPMIMKRPNTYSNVMLRAHNQSYPVNKSKVFKMDFQEETEEEMWFKPRYTFGLSEYDMTLIRIYVYMTITIYCVIMYAEQIKK